MDVIILCSNALCSAGDINKYIYRNQRNTMFLFQLNKRYAILAAGRLISTPHLTKNVEDNYNTNVNEASN
mgnify:CR=1 FL=1